MAKREKQEVKKVRNIASNKRELEVNGLLVSILPNEVIDVPTDFVVPTGMGLQVV